MQEKKESIISKIIRKFFKKKKVIEIKIVTGEEGQKLEQLYSDENMATEARERLERVNSDLWLSDQGG